MHDDRMGDGMNIIELAQLRVELSNPAIGSKDHLRKLSLSLVEALEKAQTINAAAEKLVRCKGRYHSELNYRALAALFGVMTSDLPPLDGELSTVNAVPVIPSELHPDTQELVTDFCTALAEKLYKAH